jgi:hypothetical protein
MKKIILKKDLYRKRRGGASKILSIHCRKCDSLICQYQKDGHGGLFRLYLDRIFDPGVSIVGKNLNCPRGHLLAVAMIYEKENRPAFRLFGDSIRKKYINKTD